MHKGAAAAYDIQVLADGSRPFFLVDITAVCSQSCWNTSLFKSKA